MQDAKDRQKQKYKGNDYVPAFDFPADSCNEHQSIHTTSDSLTKHQDVHAANATASPQGSKSSRHRVRIRKRRWYLGIQSKRDAGQVMLQIYRVLRILKFVRFVY